MDRSDLPAWTPESLSSDPHRVGDKAARVERMFASIAASYDLNNRLHTLGRDQVWRRRAVEMTSPRRSDVVLDAACGTGDLAILFARAGVRKVVGVDFTAEMLSLARTKAARQESLQAQLTFERGDVTDLRFDDQSFDVVSIAFGIRNVDDTARALSEFRRVLRPAGRLVILEFSEPRNRLLRAGNRIYTHRIMPLTATLIARDRSGAYRYLPRSIDTYLEPAAVTTQLKAAGFSTVRTRSNTFGVCTTFVATVD